MTVNAFVWPGLATRVVFGRGASKDLSAEAKRLGIARPLVITGGSGAEQGRATAAALGGVHFAGARMHTPVAVTAEALAFARAERIDGMIAIGGGSAIGLAKALALRSDLPQIAVPTTYAGSEMTPILGETAEGKKTTQRDPKIQPETVIYDPELTDGLPVKTSVVSGLNAVAHAVEALYARDGSPLVAIMAEAGIGAFARALPDIAAHRDEALYGAFLCGAVLALAGMALHHKLCHVLGGAFNLPHAETHAVILPHATAYNAGAAPDAMARIARALGTDTAAGGLADLAQRAGAPATLRELGLKHEDLDRAAALALASPYWNPRALDLGAIRQLLENAFHGRRPG